MRHYSVLFICRQNRFRSPMAEGLFRQRLKASINDEEWLVASAGTWTQEGQPAMSGAIAEMAARGIDISRHRTNQVSQSMVDKYQKEALCLEFPLAADRIHLLTEMVGEDWEVSDFNGLALAQYDQVAKDIENLFDRGFEKIIQLARE
jgi:protein-tyrosine-phosphatase